MLLHFLELVQLFRLLEILLLSLISDGFPETYKMAPQDISFDGHWDNVHHKSSNTN